MKKNKQIQINLSVLTLSVLLSSFMITGTVLADGVYTWTNETSGTSWHNLGWVSIASSSTGQRLAAAASGGDIYTSNNYGATWTDATPSGSVHNKGWASIISSANGQYITAGIESGSFYSSSNYGASWTVDTGIGSLDLQPQALTSDASGQYQAVASSSGIYTSSNYGASWTDESTSGPTSGLLFSSIASSSNGQDLVAVSNSNNGGHIFTSTNYGSSWTDRANNANWEAVTSSASGQYLTAATDSGYLYNSSNYGVSWTNVTPLGSSQGWQTITSSSTGQYQAAGGAYGGDIYISSNYGVSWVDDTSANAPHNRYWNVLAMNSTGQRIAAIENGTDIWNGNNPAYAPPKPGLVYQTVVVPVNGSVTVNVLSGVSGSPDESTLSIVSGPSHGSAVDPPGTITYTPNAGYTGSDSLIYQVCSSLDNTVCSQATLTFSVADGVQAPDTGFGQPNNQEPFIIAAAVIAFITTGAYLLLKKRALQKITRNN